MSLSSLSYINKLHNNFVNDLKYSSQYDKSTISIMPTLFFLTGTFFLLNNIIHRRTYALTPIHTIIYREIGFHWTYFYVIRVWFLIIKLFRLITFVLQNKIKQTPENYNFLTTLNVQVGAFAFLITISLIPSFVLLFNYTNRRHIPDFLMWVAEDPWLHSEIGIAGHYLDRPPNFTLPKRRDRAYRIHRSTSYDNITKKLNIIRNSKSDETLKCVRRIEQLFRN